jgi:ATP-dependent Clp protease ATP-binding subunit ClpB
VEALAKALAALGVKGVSVFRLDCAELTDSIQVTRLLGAPPGYTGHSSTTPLLAALEKPVSILLVDEIEKAHSDVRDLLLGLLDAGRLTSPVGNVVDARHVVVALTTSVGSDELVRAIGRTPLQDRWAVQRVCAAHLVEQGLPAELVGRIGAFAVYGELDGPEARRGIAEAAVRSLGREYGLAVAQVDPVVLDVVVDVAQQGNEAAGARGLHHAAQELLAEHFAALAGDRPRQRILVEAGPPLTVRVGDVSGRRVRTTAHPASG